MPRPTVDRCGVRLLAGLALAALASSCRTVCVAGNGNVVVEPRSVPAFEGLRIEGAAHVRAAPVGALPAGTIELEVDENLLELVTTRVRGGQLVVATRDGECIAPSRELGVRLPFEGLESLQVNGWADVECAEPVRAERFSVDVSGSADVELTDLEVSHLRTSVQGSADITYRGRAEEHEIDVSGAAEVWAPDLASAATSVRIAGAGEVRADVSRELSVSISGSGEVTYSGDARVTTSIAGSGTVTQAPAPGP